MQVDKIAGPLPLYPSVFNQKDNRIPMVTDKPHKTFALVILRPKLEWETFKVYFLFIYFFASNKLMTITS